MSIVPKWRNPDLEYFSMSQYIHSFVYGDMEGFTTAKIENSLKCSQMMVCLNENILWTYEISYLQRVCYNILIFIEYKIVYMTGEMGKCPCHGVM